MNKIDFELNDKSGIYIFTNIVNGKRYIGSSKNLYNRLHEHLHNLNHNKAHNKYFQSSWLKHGENSFIYGILEFCPDEERFVREQYYLDSLKPEYNFSTNVIANFGTSPTQETKDKISNTLKEKYASGEIKTYRQDHTWIKCFIFNVKTFKLCAECDCKKDAFRLLNMAERDNSRLSTAIFKDTYCVTLESFETFTQAKNYICEHFLICLGNFGKYLISEDSLGVLTYHKTIVDCANFTKSTRSTLSKHGDATRKNPFIVKKSKHKVYYSDEYIPYENTAVPIEKSLELLESNIGESCNANPEINSEITKGSESS